MTQRAVHADASGEGAIHPADLSDLSELVALLGELFSQEAEFEPDSQKQAEGLRLIVEDPARGSILVWRHPGAGVVGMVVLLWTVSTAEGGWVATLEDVVVAPAYRGQGIGRRLLDAGLDAARAKGCRRVSLLTDADNHRAQKVYHSRGFTDSSMRLLRLTLSPR
ncbi:MAG: GNAT family N-acetyltransferase [Planctomycetota bacterium]